MLRPDQWRHIGLLLPPPPPPPMEKLCRQSRVDCSCTGPAAAEVRARGVPGVASRTIHVSKRAARLLAELRSARASGALTSASVRRRARHMSRPELLAVLSRMLQRADGGRDRDTLWILLEVYASVREQAWYRPDLRLGARVVAALEAGHEAGKARDLWSLLLKDLSLRRNGHSNGKVGTAGQQQVPPPPSSGSDRALQGISGLDWTEVWAEGGGSIEGGELAECYEELLRAYAGEGMAEQAIATFHALAGGAEDSRGGAGVKRGSYAALVSAYAKAGRAREAVVALHQMLSAGHAPGWASVRDAMEACGRDEALWEDMERAMASACACAFERRGEGVATEGCYAVLVTAYGRAGRVDLAKDALERMKVAGREPGVSILNALVSACRDPSKGNDPFDLVSALAEAFQDHVADPNPDPGRPSPPPLEISIARISTSSHPPPPSMDLEDASSRPSSRCSQPSAPRRAGMGFGGNKSFGKRVVVKVKDLCDSSGMGFGGKAFAPCGKEGGFEKVESDSPRGQPGVETARDGRGGEDSKRGRGLPKVREPEDSKAEQGLPRVGSQPERKRRVGFGRRAALLRGEEEGDARGGAGGMELDSSLLGRRRMVDAVEGGCGAGQSRGKVVSLLDESVIGEQLGGKIVFSVDECSVVGQSGGMIVSSFDESVLGVAEVRCRECERGEEGRTRMEGDERKQTLLSGRGLARRAPGEGQSSGKIDSSLDESGVDAVGGRCRECDSQQGLARSEGDERKQRPWPTKEARGERGERKQRLWPTRGLLVGRAPGDLLIRLLVCARSGSDVSWRPLSLLRDVGLPLSACIWGPSDWILDTHGMSVGAAQIAVLLWLEEIEVRLSDRKVEAPARVEIVTGWGKHSAKIGESEVKRRVKGLVDWLEVPFFVSHDNRGVLVAKVEALRECL